METYQINKIKLSKIIKPKRSNGGSIKMSPADKSENQTLDACPSCHNKLGDPVKKTIQKTTRIASKISNLY